AFFAADMAISAAGYLIAETGSVVVMAAQAEPRSVSLLAPVHVVVAERAQLVPDLFDFFETILQPKSTSVPSSPVFITGPSKTGDIELRLVTGVHGPGVLHVVIAGCD